MAEFTTDIDTIQNLNIINEIIDAYNERRLAVGDAEVDRFEDGDIVQRLSFWQGIQNWIEGQVVLSGVSANWINYTQDIFPDVPEFYTLSSFRSAANISDGFRRAPSDWPEDWEDYNDDAYSYGIIQQGDIIGPWVFIDIMRALDALRWTRIIPARLAADSKEKYVIGGGDTEQEAIDNAVSLWSGASYSNKAFPELSYIFYRAYFLVGPKFIPTQSDIVCELVRHRATAKATLADHVAHSGVAYIVSNKAGTEYNDIDYDEGEAIELQNFELETTDEREIDEMDIDTPPVPSEYTFQTSSGAGSEVSFLAKWDFTHTLPEE